MSAMPSPETTSSAFVSGGERHEIPVEIPGRTTQTTEEREYTREEMREACRNNYNAAIRWVRNQIVDLCEATEDDPHLLVVAAKDHEGKLGAYARGRIREAGAIREALAEVIRVKVREVESNDVQS